MSFVNVMGRAWFFDDEPDQIEIWEYALEPMDLKTRSGAEWCLQYMRECLDSDDLRHTLGVPAEGNFQVIFKGRMEGWFSGCYEGDEWDECFELDESKCEPIPAEFLKILIEPTKGKADLSPLTRGFEDGTHTWTVAF